MYVSELLKNARKLFKQTDNPNLTIIDVNPYIDQNFNIYGENSADCMLRAITIAECRDYKEVEQDFLDLINKYGFRFYSTIDSYYCNERYEKVPYYLLKKNLVRMSISEFAVENKKGTYILRTSDHMTCIIDGMCYDTYDRTKSKVLDAWKVR